MAFTWMKITVFWFKLHRILFRRDQLTNACIGSGNGFASNRQQAILWGNDYLIYQRIYPSLSLSELINNHLCLLGVSSISPFRWKAPGRPPAPSWPSWQAAKLDHYKPHEWLPMKYDNVIFIRSCLPKCLCGEDYDFSVEGMITWFIWITWTLMSAVRRRLLNSITPSLTLKKYFDWQQ